MRILVVGRGGRESALLWRLCREGHRLFAAPGNAQSGLWAERWPDLGGAADAAGFDALRVRVRERRVDLVVVGPEAPLVAGLSDRLRRDGVAVLGPGAAGARLEASKVTAKAFMSRHGVPSASFAVCDTREEAARRAGAWRGPVVVKAEGLREGKGVIVTRGGAMARAAADALWRDGERLLFEERLPGRELSVLILTDGERWWGLPPARDHKRRYSGDRGPNTGGMGAVSPPDGAPEPDLLVRQVVAPTLAGLRADGVPYRGVIYLGLMVAPGGGEARVLEYNVRLGDPECQAVLARLAGPIGDVLWAAATGESGPPPGWLQAQPDASAAVVLAAPGYPGAARPGAITGDLTAEDPEGTLLLAAGAEGPAGGPWRGTGGRLLAAVARGSDARTAASRAEARLRRVRSPGASFRRDIGR